MRIPTTFVALLLILATASAANAQAPAEAAVAPPKPPPKLVFEREVYEYPNSGRRDPFRSLAGNEVSGPMFTEIVLTSIIYSPDASRSIATFHDGSNKQYRLKRGATIGNATIQFIDRTRVVFSIEEFGMRRQEVLDLKLLRAGEYK